MLLFKIFDTRELISSLCFQVDLNFMKAKKKLYLFQFFKLIICLRHEKILDLWNSSLCLFIANLQNCQSDRYKYLKLYSYIWKYIYCISSYIWKKENPKKIIHMNHPSPYFIQSFIRSLTAWHDQSREYNRDHK